MCNCCHIVLKPHTLQAGLVNELENFMKSMNFDMFNKANEEVTTDDEEELVEEDDEEGWEEAEEEEVDDEEEEDEEMPQITTKTGKLVSE